MSKQSYNTMLISVAGLILLVAVMPITAFAQGKQAPAASEAGKCCMTISVHTATV